MKRFIISLGTIALISVGIFGYTRAVEIDSVSAQGSISISGGSIPEEPYVQNDIEIKVSGSEVWGKKDVSLGEYSLEDRKNSSVSYDIYIRNNTEKPGDITAIPQYKMRSSVIKGNADRIAIKVLCYHDSEFSPLTIYDGDLANFSDSTGVIPVGYAGDPEVRLSVELSLLPDSSGDSDAMVDYAVYKLEIYEIGVNPS